MIALVFVARDLSSLSPGAKALMIGVPSASLSVDVVKVSM